MKQPRLHSSRKSAPQRSEDSDSHRHRVGTTTTRRDGGALYMCRALVSLYSLTHFTREYCGKESRALVQRSARPLQAEGMASNCGTTSQRPPRSDARRRESQGCGQLDTHSRRLHQPGPSWTHSRRQVVLADPNRADPVHGKRGCSCTGSTGGSTESIPVDSYLARSLSSLDATVRRE